MILKWTTVFLLLTTSANLLASETAKGGGGSTPTGGNPTPESQMKTVDEMKGAQAIVDPFKKYFDKCALKGTNGSESKASVQGQCRFQDMGIDRDKNQGKPSCHHKGEAIDVGAIECGGRKIDPKLQKETYMEIAKCMATEADDAFKVIYMDETPVENMMKGRDPGKHEDHMHIQLMSCTTASLKDMSTRGKKK